VCQYIQIMYNVYLISCGEEMDRKYKIGYTKNSVQKRIKQLKTGNSQELIIEKVYPSKWGTKIETILHRKYSNIKISGEWFKLTEEQVKSFEKDCENLEEYLNYMIDSSTFTNPKTILI